MRRMSMTMETVVLVKVAIKMKMLWTLTMKKKITSNGVDGDVSEEL